MKKTFVKLATVAALVAVAAPLATVAANNPSFNEVNTKGDHTTAHLGRAYEVAAAKAGLAYSKYQAASAERNEKAGYVFVAEGVVKDQEVVNKAANDDYENALAGAVRQHGASGPAYNAAVAEIEAAFAPVREQAAEALAAAKANLAEVVKASEAAIAAAEKAEAEYVAAQQAQEAAKNAFLNAGGKLDEKGNAVLPAEKSPADKAPGEKAPGEKAPGEKAPAGQTPASGKKQATNVAPAKTATAEKALPKTSAVK